MSNYHDIYFFRFTQPFEVHISQDPIWANVSHVIRRYFLWIKSAVQKIYNYFFFNKSIQTQHAHWSILHKDKGISYLIIYANIPYPQSYTHLFYMFYTSQQGQWNCNETTSTDRKLEHMLLFWSTTPIPNI